MTNLYHIIQELISYSHEYVIDDKILRSMIEDLENEVVELSKKTDIKLCLD